MNSSLAIPILDILAIGISRESGTSDLTVLGLLLVLPIVWISITLGRAGVLLSVTITVLSALLIPFALQGYLPMPSLIRPVLLAIVAAAIALSAHLLARTVARQRIGLHRQDAKLENLLDAAAQRQRLLDTIVETAGVGVWALDEKGHTILMNRRQHGHLARTKARTGLAPAETVMEVYGCDRTTPVPDFEHPVHRAIRGQKVIDQLIWAGQGAQQVALSVTARDLKDPSGRRAGSVLAFTDVTTIVAALTAKDEFLSNVSHELRTPLTSILGYMDLALEHADILPGAVAQHLSVVQRNADHLLGLIADLLCVSADTMQITARPSDLRDIVAASFQSAQPAATGGGNTLILTATEPLPVLLDPGRIGQVVDNLISNAIKYSPDGGPINIRTYRNHNTVTCEISDSGIGMTEDEQALAFDKFFRSGHARASALPGIGLGLPIAKTIIERHGGTIMLASVPGTGTKVAFHLPATSAEPCQGNSNAALTN